MKMKSEREVAQSCPTLSDPIDCSLPGSSVHGIFQAKVLEWGAIAFSGEGTRTHNQAYSGIKWRLSRKEGSEGTESSVPGDGCKLLAFIRKVQRRL